jgi:hypothetical protein
VFTAQCTCRAVIRRHRFCAGLFPLATLCATETTLHRLVCALGFSREALICWTGLLCGNTAMTAVWQTHSYGLPGRYCKKSRFAILYRIGQSCRHFTITLVLLQTGSGCEPGRNSSWAAVGRSQSQGSTREWKSADIDAVRCLPLLTRLYSTPLFMRV